MTVVAVAKYGIVTRRRVPAVFRRVKRGTDLAYWECVGTLQSRGRSLEVRRPGRYRGVALAPALCRGCGRVRHPRAGLGDGSGLAGRSGDVLAGCRAGRARGAAPLPLRPLQDRAVRDTPLRPPRGRGVGSVARHAGCADRPHRRSGAAGAPSRPDAHRVQRGRGHARIGRGVMGVLPDGWAGRRHAVGVVRPPGRGDGGLLHGQHRARHRRDRVSAADAGDGGLARDVPVDRGVVLHGSDAGGRHDRRAPGVGPVGPRSGDPTVLAAAGLLQGAPRGDGRARAAGRRGRGAERRARAEGRRAHARAGDRPSRARGGEPDAQ